MTANNNTNDKCVKAVQHMDQVIVMACKISNQLRTLSKKGEQSMKQKNKGKGDEKASYSLGVVLDNA